MSKDQQAPLGGAVIDFAARAEIFREGDGGGDLFFIKEGEVEVYRTLGDRDVPLAVLKAGEVLGIMTCLTREPRLASARALTPVKALVVKQAGIKTLISSTPPWVHTVIKDFTLRVKAMDDLYAAALQRIDALELELSSLRLAMRVAKGLARVGALTAVAVGDAKVVDVDKALVHLAEILDATPAAVDAVFRVFLDVGLLKADPNAASRRADLAVLERLTVFADLGRFYLTGPDQRLAVEALYGRDAAFLQTMCDFVKAQKMKLGEPCKLRLSLLANADFPAEFVAASLRRAEKARLLTVEEAGGETHVVFTPAALLSGVHGLAAIAALRGADWTRSRAGVAQALA